MVTTSKLRTESIPGGHIEENDAPRDEIVSTVKLWLVIITIFGAVILMGFTR